MLRILTYLPVLLACFGASPTKAENQAITQWPLQDNGLNTVVQWDHYSFQINGQRLFIFSGEFHYWRIPVPGLWRDILEKIKAAGFTAFAFYSSWAYHAPNNATVDFTTGAHDITPIFELAKELGLYIIVRPGPYVNAEANAGGFPLWLTTGEYGTLRNNDTRYTNAWTPYFTEMTEITSRYQVTDGHNSICYQIENEYGNQWLGDASLRVPNQTAIAYMELLEANARAHGITVPLTVNDPNMNTHSWGKDWSDEGGNVDVAGVDSYPSCWTCDLSQCTSTNGAYVPFQVMDYSDYFEESQPNMPSFMPEFQGGSYNPWGGPEGGCHDQTTGALNPRGILDARLLGSTTGFTNWRLAGTAGGESNLDPVRGVYNEDGLFAERIGWHLPGYDDSDWTETSANSVLRFEGATVRFFRTTIPLSLPADTDISISFVLSTPSGTTQYRAQLFVNGYQYGRYNPYIGNQVVYPVPVGVLNYTGENTIGVAVWAQSEEGASVGIDWRVNYVADSSLDVASMDTTVLRPGWTEERLKFA